MNESDEITRLRVAVLYGGRSTEHEISQQSAAAVVANLDPAKYEVIPISIDKQGRFHRHDLAALRAHNPKQLATESSSAALTLAARPGPLFLSQGAPAPAIDVVFPVMHGPLCEDGSIQGLLELAAVPYVGARVLGSAIGMDKDVAKRLVRAEGIDVAPYVVVQRNRWERERAGIVARAEAELGYPMFVKPATLGSSVGVSRVTDRAQLEAAVLEAQRFDDKTLIEQSVDAREIEFAVLAAEDPAALPDVSVPGEIIPRDAFYSFERKYLDAEGAELHAPAKLSEDLAREGQALARRIFLSLECEGMARVDMFLDRKSGRYFFNEVNTIPGFTAISMYPKLWEVSGLSYSALLDRLIRDAVRRHARRSELQRER
ncbi:MAG TPA: D-alanine--D-alanine ligase family protein [Polyangiales bacterium]|nr:D-alanine--D-alanine ligase family protein [Polyangiales bacterium]